MPIEKFHPQNPKDVLSWPGPKQKYDEASTESVQILYLWGVRMVRLCSQYWSLFCDAGLIGGELHFADPCLSWRSHSCASLSSTPINPGFDVCH